MTTFIIRQVNCYLTKLCLPHRNDTFVLTYVPHLLSNSTTINSKKSEINDYLYHAKGNLLFYKKIPAAW